MASVSLQQALLDAHSALSSQCTVSVAECSIPDNSEPGRNGRHVALSAVQAYSPPRRIPAAVCFLHGIEAVLVLGTTAPVARGLVMHRPNNHHARAHDDDVGGMSTSAPSGRPSLAGPSSTDRSPPSATTATGTPQSNLQRAASTLVTGSSGAPDGNRAEPGRERSNSATALDSTRAGAAVQASSLSARQVSAPAPAVAKLRTASGVA
jgi:hypothetical protein